MEPRTAAQVLNEIATLLELRGDARHLSQAHQSAARAIQSLDSVDIAPLLRSGAIAKLPGVDDAAIAVLQDLVETGDSQILEQLREATPEGLLEMLRVPGLGTSRIHQIHVGLGIETLHGLEEAARDGRLAALPRFGARTAEKALKGIALLKESGASVLFPHAEAEARRLLAAVRAHPDVVRADIAGSLRRCAEVIGDVDIVAACRTSPERVAAAVAHGPGVRDVVGGGGRAVSIRFLDGTRLDLFCVSVEEYPVALWRATGSDRHLADVLAHARGRGFAFIDDVLRAPDGFPVSLGDEGALYTALDLAVVPPELREGRGEVARAAARTLPRLVESADIRGVLHCHSQYSDGASSIAELAHAAQALGWSYLGVSDHSQSAFYAGGLTRDAILRQHDEIDEVNSRASGFRVLKGIEADILPCGRVDYDPAVLDRFDYVIGSIHSRFGMNETQMTDRVLKALDDPHLTILGHPTGRLLLTREPYAIDVDAVIARAGEVGAAIELNADPHRLDLDWRFLPLARAHGVKIEIGPDAHSVQGLVNLELGVGIARKGGLESSDVLNASSAGEVISFAQSRRTAITTSPVMRGS